MNSHFLKNSNYTYTNRVLFIEMRYLVFIFPLSSSAYQQTISPVLPS